LTSGVIGRTDLTVQKEVMNKKNLTMIALASALLAGAMVFAVIRSGTDRDTGNNPAGGEAAPAMTAAAESGLAPSTGDRRTRSRERESRADAELTARYGEVRTGTARHITIEISNLLDDVVGMGELAMDGQMADIMGAGAFIPMILHLDLTEEQRETARALLMEHRRRNLDELKQAAKNLRNSPEDVMALILSGDAQTRGAISEEEHRRNQEEAANRLTGILNPLDRGNFQAGDPLGDEAFVAGMRGILDEDQSARFQERVDKRPQTQPTNISTLPAMDLERLDQAVSSGRKLTGGLRQMMEGVGGLQDIAPLMENR